MYKNTLYGLNKEEASVLCSNFNNDVALLGIALWNRNRASSLERGIYKAKKLVKFSKEGRN